MPTTWNPDDLSQITLSFSDLTATSTGGTSSVTAGVRSIDRFANGKYYWEVTFNTVAQTTTGMMGNGPLTGLNVPTNAVMIYGGGNVWLNGSNVLTFPAITAGQTIGIAADLDDPVPRIWFRVTPSGNWNNLATNDPATGAGGINIGALGSGTAFQLYACAGFYSTGRQVTANFGSGEFLGPVPSGFTAGLPSGSRPPTAAIATQFTLEQWGVTNTDTQAWMTQAYVEQWASSLGSPVQVTQIALEVFADNTTPAVLKLDRVYLEQWVSADAEGSAAEIAHVAVEMWSINVSAIQGTYMVSGDEAGHSAIIAETTRGPTYVTALPAVVTEGAFAETQTGITLMLQGVRATTRVGVVSYAREPVGVFATGEVGSPAIALLDVALAPLTGVVADGVAGLIIGAIAPQFAGVFATGVVEPMAVYTGPAIFVAGVYATGIGEPIYAIAGGIPAPFIFFMGGPF